jgi:ATP-dependent DNA ligase
MRLARRSEPFDHPDWIYEIKFDGFRALAYVESGKCRLVPTAITNTSPFIPWR